VLDCGVTSADPVDGVALLLPVALVSDEVEPVEGEAVVEGEVVEVAPALPLIDPLCPLCAAPAAAAPAGCVQGWLLVLPVALPVVPPVCGEVEDEPAALPVELEPAAEPVDD